MRHIFLIEDAESHWYSAEDKAQALKIHGEAHQLDPEDLDECDIEEMPDDKELKVFLDEPFHDPTPSKTQTCGQWAKEQEGFIASSLC